MLFRDFEVKGGLRVSRNALGLGTRCLNGGFCEGGVGQSNKM